MQTPTKARLLTLCCAVAASALVTPAQAVSSAELYTSASYSYGRFEARVQFAGGDGVVGSFFLWKDGSEMDGVFWNELDLETVWSDCELFTNALYGNPEMVHSDSAGTAGNWCGSFHTYAYEWTPDYIAWFVDGMEIRRETGEDSTAFRDNAADGMQIHFNVWPGDSTFGGNFNPSILPLHQYINWVQYSSYADGAFTLEWREDFSGDTLPEGWVTGDWGSPKGLSTHSPANVAFMDGYAVISMTADDATGSAGAVPMDPEGGGPVAEPEPEPEPDDGMPPDDVPPMEPEQTGGAPGDDGEPNDGDPVPGAGGAPDSPPDPGTAGMTSVGDPVGPSEPGTPASGSGGTAGGTPPPPSGPGPAGPQPGPQTVPAPGTPSDPADPGATPPGTPAPMDGAGAAAPPSTAAPETTSDAANDGGSGCRMTRATGDASSWAALLLLLCAGGFRRRKRA